MKINSNPKIAIAGSVNSSLQTLKKLAEHNINVVHVLALNPEKGTQVSGYKDLKVTADELGYSSSYFSKINAPEVYEELKYKDVDLFFVVGLSQMVKEPLLSLAKAGNVGFHPTRLPEGRGRGALAWLILGEVKGAATFFLLEEGMDSGDILGQQSFEVTHNDYVEDVLEKIKSAIDKVLDDLLPVLNKGLLVTKKQDHSNATFLGVRRPKDGQIDWSKTSFEVRKLIRATSAPLPGAFSRFNNHKVIVWKAQEYNQYKGVPGRIIDIVDEKLVVSCGEGALLLEEIALEDNSQIEFIVGKDFSKYE